MPDTSSSASDSDEHETLLSQQKYTSNAFQSNLDSEHPGEIFVSVEGYDNLERIESSWSLRGITRAVRGLFRSAETSDTGSSSDRSWLPRMQTEHVNPWRLISGLIAYSTFWLLFLIIAAQPLIAGELTTFFQTALGVDILPLWAAETANWVGLISLAYVMTLEPFEWVAVHQTPAWDFWLWDIFDGIRAPRSAVKTELGHLFPGAAPTMGVAGQDFRLLTTSTLIQSEHAIINDLPDDYGEGAHSHSSSEPIRTNIAWWGLGAKLYQLITYGYLPTTAAVPGFTETNLLEFGIDLTPEVYAYIRTGGYAGILLATVVQLGYLYTAINNEQDLQGTKLDAFSHAIHAFYATFKSLLRHYFPAFKTWDDELMQRQQDRSPLSASVLLSAMAGTLFGLVHRLVLWVLPLFGLPVGVIDGYAFFAHKVYTLAQQHEQRLSTLPWVLAASTVQIADATLSTENQRIGQAAGHINAFFQGTSDPYGSSRRISGEVGRRSREAFERVSAQCALFCTELARDSDDETLPIVAFQPGGQ